MPNGIDNHPSNHLLQQMKGHSKQSFEMFYEQYVTFVLQIALGIMKDRGEAEDVCHDVFLEVYQHPEQYDARRGSVEAWLAVKTRSRCLDRLRKKQPVLVGAWQDAPELWSDQSVAAETEALLNVESETVRSAMANIPEAQRNVLYRSYFENRTHRELSEEMQRPLGTIKSLVRYGLNNLRKQLSVLGWSGPGGSGKK